ncbi:MAG TPA: galactonate dehydratase, partial [Chloroflexi bacterium]|nr:galactonate dehydratase [Chloroflexota bacterium]
MKTLNQTLHLHPMDNVAIARVDLRSGIEIEVKTASGERNWLTIRDRIPAGHKVALIHLDSGDPVCRYGEVIGTASKEINPGEHIHTHNLAMLHSLDEKILVAQVEPVTPVPESEQRTF